MRIMDDPLDPLTYVDFDDFVAHGDPLKWKFKGQKRGSPTVATSPSAPEGTMKHYDIYVDVHGDTIDLHYFRYLDGTPAPTAMRRYIRKIRRLRQTNFEEC